MKGRLCCWLMPAAFLLDRLTKLWATGVLKNGFAMDVLPGLLRFVYVENTGAAFGMLRGRQTLLLILTGIALAGTMGYVVARRKALPDGLRAGIWLLLGGALGNFADRLLYGYVIDFIQIRLFDFPVFNVADMCVCAAFIWLAALILFGKEKEAKTDG